MGKFKSGDKVYCFDYDGDEKMYRTVKNVDEYDPNVIWLTNGHWMYKHSLFLVEEQKDEKLPEMPNEVTYRGSGRELTVAPYHTSLGDIFIGIRTDGGYGVQIMHMDAEDVLSLCHDLRRYAMDAIRNRDK